MKSHRKATAIAGVLIITGMVAGILSISPALDAPDYLTKASANANQVITEAFFQFVIAAAYVGIAVVLYPFLKRYNESLALGFLSFRIIAAVFLIAGMTSALLLLELSQQFVKAGGLDSTYFQTVGGLLRTGRDLVNHVAMPWSLIVSALMLYFILYQTKLVPRWLSGWGLVGTTVSIWATLLVMFHLIEIITPTYIILAIPWALQEMVLAVWLIVKGFNPSVVASESEE
jgi:hypothetical protein